MTNEIDYKKISWHLDQPICFIDHDDKTYDVVPKKGIIKLIVPVEQVGGQIIKERILVIDMLKDIDLRSLFNIIETYYSTNPEIIKSLNGMIYFDELQDVKIVDSIELGDPIDKVVNKPQDTEYIVLKLKF